MADDNRRQILLLLRKNEMTPSQIVSHFDFTLPALSSHLKILRDAELVKERKQGKNRFYSLNREKTMEMMQFFNLIWENNLQALKEYVENRRRGGRRK